MSTTLTVMSLRVAVAEPAARGIQRFELRHPEGAELPAFTAGAHIRIKTPSGAMRQYSLSNDPAERDRYVIAVKREGNGRGGSLSLVDGVRRPVDENGRARGQFVSTGIRPSFIPRLEAHGVRLPASAFRERIMLKD